MWCQACTRSDGEVKATEWCWPSVCWWGRHRGSSKVSCPLCQRVWCRCSRSRWIWKRRSGWRKGKQNQLKTYLGRILTRHASALACFSPLTANQLFFRWLPPWSKPYIFRLIFSCPAILFASWNENQLQRETGFMLMYCFLFLLLPPPKRDCDIQSCIKCAAQKKNKNRFFFTSHLCTKIAKKSKTALTYVTFYSVAAH